MMNGETNVHSVIGERHGHLVAELYRRGKDKTQYSLLARDRNFGPTVTRRCQRVGNETMGLFPIRLNNVTYGLIQCNDPTPGLITPDAIDLLEGLATDAAQLLQKSMD